MSSTAIPRCAGPASLQPGMKLDPRLWSNARIASAAQQPDGSYEIYVNAFRGVPAPTIAAALQKLVPGVRITAQSLRADAAQYVRASVSVSALDALLRAATSIDGVAFIEPWIQPVYHNSGAIGAIQGNSTAACAGSGPVCGPTPIWDHGILGSGQIAGIADSGTTPNAAWFTTLNNGTGEHEAITFADDPPPVPPVIGNLFPDNKILGYWVQPGAFPYDAGVFHGTHTTGTLVGDAAGTFGATTYLASTPTVAEPRARRRHGAERATSVPGHRRRFVDVGHRARFRRHDRTIVQRRRAPAQQQLGRADRRHRTTATT